MYAMYCRDVLKKKKKKRNALNWQECSVGDIAHYLGISMLMGIIRLPNVKLYLSNENLYKFQLFTNVMTSARYQELSRFVHAFNKLAVPADNKDKLILVRPVMEYLQVLCKQHYLPNQELSLDEGIMPYKGRLSIKIYSPQKPDKYGVKFYFLCEAASGYVYSFSVYRGVSQTLKEIVYNLLSGLFGQGYHVYMDNYYNWVNLARDLYADKVHCTGTLRLPRGAAPLSSRAWQDGDFLATPTTTFETRTSSLCVGSTQGWCPSPLLSMVSRRRCTRTRKGCVGRGIVRSRVSLLIALWPSGSTPSICREWISLTNSCNTIPSSGRRKGGPRKSCFTFRKLGCRMPMPFTENIQRTSQSLTHLKFHTVAIEALIYFDPEEWPVVGPLIPHAPNLPQTPAAVPPVLRTPGTRRSSSPDDPNSPPPRTPPGSPPADTPGPSRRPRLVDPPQRLQSYKKHFLVTVSGPGRQK